MGSDGRAAVVTAAFWFSVIVMILRVVVDLDNH
jgi:hypothetical protein